MKCGLCCIVTVNKCKERASITIITPAFQVLTANVATLVDLYGVEKGLDHFRSTATLSFQHFRYYLAQEVFSALALSQLSPSELRSHETKIDEVNRNSGSLFGLSNTEKPLVLLQICWLVCRKSYITENSVYPEQSVYKLFRIFCMLADLTERDDVECEVHLHSSEAIQIIQQLLVSLGLDHEAEKQYEYLMNSDIIFRFDQFLELVQFRELCQDNFECRQSLTEAIDEIFQTYIKDIIKKGFLMRKGYLLPTMREYWFVLQPCELHYYKTSQEREHCGTIPLDSKCVVKPFSSPNGKQDRVQKFVLTSGDRNYELAASDHRSRMQWIASLQLAITYSAGREGFQRDSTARRRQQREANKQKRQHEELVRSTHIQEAQQTKALLEREKLARMAAENQAKELKAVAREDSRRVAELEDVKLTLEKLLEEETQAKRDEEIVRALQARVLADEWEKREELELLQEEQKALLEQERQKRIEFEEKQKENVSQLKQAEKRLRELEEERQRLDLELKMSRCKIQQSEDTKEFLESKLYAFCPGVREVAGTKIRRALSFVPSTKQRPNIEIRKDKVYITKSTN